MTNSEKGAREKIETPPGLKSVSFAGPIDKYINRRTWDPEATYLAGEKKKAKGLRLKNRGIHTNRQARLERASRKSGGGKAVWAMRVKLFSWGHVWSK